MLYLPNARVHLSGPLGGDVIDALRDLERRAPIGSDHTTPWHLQLVSDDTGFSLWHDDHGIRSGIAPVDVVDSIVAVLNRWALDSDPARLHLHAACVELHGRGIVLGGRTGSGKTTLTAALMRRGARYLTDESLTVPPGSRAVVAYPKPLTVKVGGPEDDWDSDLPPPSTSGRIAVPASNLGSLAPYTTVSIIALVRHLPGARTTVTEISPAEATVLLLADSLDAHRLSGGAIDVVAQLTGRATCVEVVYGDASDAAEHLAGLPGPRPSTWRTSLDLRPDWPAQSGGLRVAVFSNSAAALEYPSGKLVQLTHEETEALRSVADGGSLMSALGRLNELGIDVPPSSLVTPITTETPQERGSFGMPDLTALHRYCCALEDAGIEAVLGGPLLMRLDGVSPASDNGPLDATLFVRESNLHAARALFGSTRSALDTDGRHGRWSSTNALTVATVAGPPRRTGIASFDDLLAESVPVMLEGEWVRGLGPYHRFIDACARAAFAHGRAPHALVEVARTAPRVGSLAVASVARAADTGALAVLHRATAGADRIVGGLEPALLVGRGRRKARAHQRLRYWIDRLLGPRSSGCRDERR